MFGSVAMDIAFGTLIVLIPIILIAVKRKEVMRFFRSKISSYPILMVILEERAGSMYICFDSGTRVIAADKTEEYLLLNRNVTIKAPGLKDIYPCDGHAGCVFVHHDETDVWSPCKFDKTTGRIIVLDQDSKHFWANQLEKAYKEDLEPGFWEKYGWIAAPLFLGFGLACMLYVILPYITAPLGQASNALTQAINYNTEMCRPAAMQNITSAW